MSFKSRKLTHIGEMAPVKKMESQQRLPGCNGTVVSWDASKQAAAVKKQTNKTKTKYEGNLNVTKILDKVQLSISDFECGSMSSWSDLPTPASADGFHQTVSNSDSGIKVSSTDVHLYNRNLAGMKIFAAMMTVVWRKRREECAGLKNQLDTMKKTINRLQDRYRRIEAYLLSEKKTNDSLSGQLRDANNMLKNARAAEEIICVEASKFKAEYCELQKQYEALKQEYDDQGEVLANVRRELFEAVTENGRVHQTLCNVKRETQEIEIQKEELINQIFEINEEFADRERKLQMRMERCETCIQNLLNELNEYKRLGIVFPGSSEVGVSGLSELSDDSTCCAHTDQEASEQLSVDSLEIKNITEKTKNDENNHVNSADSNIKALVPTDFVGMIGKVIDGKRLGKFWWRYTKYGISMFLYLTYNAFPIPPQTRLFPFSNFWRADDTHRTLKGPSETTSKLDGQCQND